MPLFKPPYRKTKISLFSIAVLLIVYTVAGFYGVPWLLKSQTPSLVKENLGRKAQLTEATFNPYTLELDLQGFEILEADQQHPFVSFERLYLNYGLWKSIQHGAVAAQQITLSGLYSHIDKVDEHHFNFSDLASSEPEPEPTPPEEKEEGLFPVWIGNIAIQNSEIKFEDHALPTPYSKDIKDINIEANNLTTAREGEAPYDLTLALKSGGTIRVQGDVVLDPLSSNGKLTLSELNVHSIWEYLRDSVDFKIDEGLLKLEADYVFNSNAEQTKLSVTNGQIGLQDFLFETLGANSTRLNVPSLELADIQVALLSSKQASTINISNSNITTTGISIQIAGPDTLNIKIPTIKLGPNTIAINSTENNSQIDINHQQLGVNGFAMKSAGNGNYFIDTSDLTLDQIAINIVNTDDASQAVLQINDKNLQLKGLKIGSTSDSKALVSIPHIAVNDTKINLKDQTVTINSLNSNKALIDSWLTKDGTFNLATLFSSPAANAKTKTAPASTTSEKPANDAAWKVAINTIALSDYALKLEDRSPSKAAQFSIDPIKLTINKFSTDFSKPLQLDLATHINKTGKFNTKGSVVIQPLNTQLNIEASSIPLKGLQPYIDKFAKLRLRNGNFSLKGALKLAANSKGAMTGSFKGDSNISRLHTIDTIANKDFLKWKKLNVKGISYHLQPPKLVIREVSTDQLYSRIIINKDKTTNISGIFPSDESKTKPAAKQTKKASTNKDGMPISVGTIKINNAAAYFSDLSLVLPFALDMTDLNGAIKGINSKLDQQADVRLDGKVNKISPVVIKGSLEPFHIEDFLDLSLNLNGVNLTAITPYMAQFAGYTVEKGKVSLDLQYKIKDKKLNAENKVIIDQLTLGEEVDSPDAVSLPVKLGIALLQDQNGVIDLNLPMEGSLDDPEFSILSILAKVLFNLLTKAITSPFSLLGGLVGSEDDLSSIAFAPGISTLTAEQQQQLQTVSEALKSRPALKMEVKGVALKETDRQGLIENQLMLRIKNKMWKKLAKDDLAPASPDQVELTEAKINKYLLKFYEDDFPDAEEPEMIETADGEEQVPEAYYHLAKQQLLGKITVQDSQLQLLAQQRANNIAHFMVETAGLAADRLFVVKETVDAETENNSAETVKVQLSLTAP